MLTQSPPEADLIDLWVNVDTNVPVTFDYGDGVVLSGLDVLFATFRLSERVDSGMLLELTSGGGGISLSDGVVSRASGSLLVDTFQLMVPDSSGELLLGGWSLGFGINPDPQTLPTTPMLTWSATKTWLQVCNALVDVVNTGDTSASGFTLLNGVGKHPTVSAEFIAPSSGTEYLLKFTSLDSGYSGNYLSYSFTDSQGSFDSSGFFTGGSDGETGVISITSANSALLLRDSYRPTGEVLLVGQASFVDKSNRTFTKDMRFKLKQIIRDSA